ncbi:MAG TPA: hypothetical protein VFT16_01180 [Candidatus Saccharimonadales bacterium]|nr:hypothetical protein [Candidatus Saccharimonadales bacterium]
MGNINGGHLLVFVMVVMAVTIFVIWRSPQAPAGDLPDKTRGQSREDADLLPRWQRAVMVVFVANVMGFGANSKYFARLRSSIDQGPLFSGRMLLTNILEDASQKYGIRLAGINQVQGEIFVAMLVDDSAFNLSCARLIDYIDKLRDEAFSITAPDDTPIPDELIIGQEVIDAYRTLLDRMWPDHYFGASECG